MKMVIRKIIKVTLASLLILLVIRCSNKKMAKVHWRGDLIHKSAEINYLYWRDGNQIITQQNDQMTVSYTGFAVGRTVYILLSIANDKVDPITFYKKDCILTYKWGYRMIDLRPIRNKDLGKNHLSLFNSLIRSAGNVTRMFINIPLGEIIKDNNEERLALENIGQEYGSDYQNMTHKIFISNHTIFPGTDYAGFLVFEFDRKTLIESNPFQVEVELENMKFVATGHLSY